MIDIRKKINKSLNNWEEELNKDEWYFSNLRDEILQEITPEEAFNYIPDVVKICLELKDKYLVGEIFEILLDLVKRTNTTEIPSYLEKNWEALINYVSSIGDYNKRKTKELKGWYRK